MVEAVASGCGIDQSGIEVKPRQRRRLATKINIIDEELGDGELPAIRATPWREKERAGLVAEMAKESASVDTYKDRLKRSDDLEDRKSVGEILPKADELWLGGYQGTSEYRIYKQMQGDPNVAWLRKSGT